VYDGNGLVIDDATITVVDPGTGLSYGNGLMADGSVDVTGAGYYDLTVAKGTRTILVSAPGYDSVEIELDVNGHTKQNITLIPEPSILVALFAGILILRKRWNRNS